MQCHDRSLFQFALLRVNRPGQLASNIPAVSLDNKGNETEARSYANAREM